MIFSFIDTSKKKNSGKFSEGKSENKNELIIGQENKV